MNVGVEEKVSEKLEDAGFINQNTWAKHPGIFLDIDSNMDMCYLFRGLCKQAQVFLSVRVTPFSKYCRV
jgi:hypothetical protein